MNTTTWLTKEELFPKALAKLEQVEVVLDIGPGIQPQKLIHPLVHICCEPFHQYVERLHEISATAKDRAYVVLKITWAEVVNVFPENSVDTIVLLDVIEHLEKEEGRQLLKKSLRIARRQVVIFTTLGFVQQHHSDGKDAWGLDGGIWQEHKSGWMPEDFGTGWDVLVAKEFHLTDNMGKDRTTPAGALWAIYTKPKSKIAPSFRNLLLELWKSGVRNNYRPTIRLSIAFLNASNKSKRFIWPILKWFIQVEK